MRLIFTAPGITDPTYETLQEYAEKKFAKINKLLPVKKDADYEVRISVKKSRDVFEISADVVDYPNGVVHTKDRDMRRAIDMLSDQLKENLSKGKEKKIDLRRFRGNVRKFFGKS